jgi:hypothetical protein
MPKPSELIHFYWYCATATQLIENLPRTTATNAVSLYAVRRATETFTGKNGVPYASARARKACADNGGKWEGCGLVREHAIPVSHIHRGLEDALSVKRSEETLAEARRRLEAELMAIPAKAGTFQGYPANPQIAFVVDIIRASTTLAWLTVDEDNLLNERLGDGSKSLKMRMPPNWDGRDPLARYRFCEIEVQPV